MILGIASKFSFQERENSLCDDYSQTSHTEQIEISNKLLLVAQSRL